MLGQCCYREPEFLVASRRQAALTLDIGANPVKHDTGRIIRVNLGNFGHQVYSDIHLQTLEIQMRRLLMSRLIRIFIACLDS